MSDTSNYPQSDPATDSIDVIDADGAGGGTSNKKAVIGGAVGLGIVGMLLLGLVVINDDGDPLDEADPDLAEAVLREGMSDDGPVGADFGDPLGDPVGDPLGHPGGDGLTDDDDGGLVIEPEEGSDVILGGNDGGDILIGDPGDDVIDGGDTSDDLLGDAGDPLLGDSPTGLKQLCAEVEHSSPPGMEDTALSGIWVRGEVYGLAEGTWIWVEGATLNNGEPTRIPVVDGSFDAPLGINSYGDHTIDRFELQVGDQAPIDLLPTLADAIDGEAFPVGPDEGPLFDDECFDFDPPSVLADEAADTDTDTDTDTAEPMLGVEVVDPFDEADLEQFFDEFAAAHVNGDATGLWNTLHPAVPSAFGESTCRSYLDDTLGSIASTEVIEVIERGPWEFRTLDGPVPFPDAFAVQVEFTTSTGDVLPLEAHVPVENGEPFWLTTCNVDVP